MTFLNTTKDDCHCFQCVCVQCVQSVLSLTALLTEVYCSVFHLYKNTIVGFHQRISSSCQMFFNLFFFKYIINIIWLLCGLSGVSNQPNQNQKMFRVFFPFNNFKYVFLDPQKFNWFEIKKKEMKGSHRHVVQLCIHI